MTEMDSDGRHSGSADVLKAQARELLVERVAKAIYDAEDPLSGDSVATVINCSVHLFPSPENYEGVTEVEANLRATMDVCRAAARAAISVLDPDEVG